MHPDGTDPFEALHATIAPLARSWPVGRIDRVDAAGLDVTGLSDDVTLGDELRYRGPGAAPARAEVVALDGARLRAMPFGAPAGVARGLEVTPSGPPSLGPRDDWIGRLIDPFGAPLDGRPLTQGRPRPVRAAPPPAARRRGLGARLDTGIAVIDTMLPIASGQRLGLFAGSGVGKSTLLGAMARRLACDVCVIALVGERGREVGQVVRETIGAEAMAHSVVIAATADQPAATRRRAALSAMTVAEHFRDAGRHVAFFCDSVTRLAEAHRELAASAGEPLDARGQPASLTPFLAELTERAGPGADAQGDITAVLTVLVAGADMDEPVADILRGQLDGHVVLSRTIAEAGRYPAVDVVRSVSRSLPSVATEAENALIAEARRYLSVMDRSELMVSSGLYDRGASPEIDRAVALVPGLNEVFTRTGLPDAEAAFQALAAVLGRRHG